MLRSASSRRWRSCLFLALLWLALGVPAGQAAEVAAEQAGGSRPSLAALAIDEPIVIDGVLDDAAWALAEIGTGFTQREPREGAPAGQRSEFRVVYTPTTLYIGFHAFEEDPGKIIAKQMARDSRLAIDDSVIVILDTFHDRRNGYFFETNPNGARTDILISDDGDGFNVEWDGLWQARARRTADGWTAEMAIPFSTLRFDPKLDTWGLNVRRLIQHDNEEVYWSQVGLDGSVSRVSRAGTLTGLRGLRSGRDLRVRPYASGSADRSPGSGSGRRSELGADVQWGLSRGSVLDLTYNTDFAETEVDALQVNLTRFSLFFPEKRDFFLENAGIFQFGPGAPDLDLFFSRRIGIDQGAQVPMNWGARLTGRAGGWSFGLLDAETAAFSSPEVTAPKNNWGVMRLRRDVGERSVVGAIVTRRASSGGDDNLAWGLDADLNPLENLSVNAFLAGTDDTAAGNGLAFGASAEWSGSLWDWELGVQEIDAEFQPATGFVRRRGVRRYRQRLSYEPRPDLPGVRNLDFGLRTEVVAALDGEIETVESTFDLFGLETDREDQLQVEARFTRERLVEPFEIRPGVVIAPGEYDFASYGIELESNRSRAVAGELEVSVGDFFDGERVGYEARLYLQPSRFFKSETVWERNEIDLPAGSFETNVLLQRFGVSFNPELSLNALAQYVDAEEALSLNLRLRWIYRPGSDLFVVFNQLWDAPGLSDLTAGDRQVIVKLTYLWAL